MSKNGSKTLSNNFIGEISQVFNGKPERDNPNAVLQDYIFNKTLFAKTYNDYNSTLKNIRSDNMNKLIFVHLNINSIKIKSDFLAEQIRRKIDILMISKTKIDKIFHETIS